jgi:hypothetical protein
MSDGPPEVVAIEADEYAARHVGRTADGRQFFLTTPFVGAYGKEAGREFIALYLFNNYGELLEAQIDDLGTRKALDKTKARLLYERRLGELGEVTFGRIEIQPFELERFGVVFGFIPLAPDDEEGDWSVIVQPGNYMAFFPPWNGDYDT